MKIQIMTLCDAANVDTSGKLNILGSFDQILSVQEPLVHPWCILAIKLRFDQVEEGVKKVKILFVDNDGKQVFPAVTGDIQITIPPNWRTGTSQIIMGIQQLKLPHFGEYQIDLALDGNLVGSIPLFARKIEQPPSS